MSCKIGEGIARSAEQHPVDIPKLLSGDAHFQKSPALDGNATLFHALSFRQPNRMIFITVVHMSYPYLIQ